MTCIDLTTLAGDDTLANVNRLCFKAKHPVRQDLLKAMDMDDICNYRFVLNVAIVTILICIPMTL